jgi:hypothetical protein
MREIKFRAWDKRQKQMSNPLTLTELTQYEHHFESKFPNLAKWKDLIWLEYTGLRDSYAVEEYYGDIVEDDDGTRRVIEDGCSAVLFKNIKTGAINYFWQLSKPHKVIGNIYENPELLEAK